MKRKGSALRAVVISVFLAAVFQAPSSYSQEAIAPTDMGKSGISAIGKDTAVYVKPGNVTVNFKDADIKAVLNYLSEVSGVDIVPSPDVSGPVTLKLTDKPWEVALEIIVKNYGFAYEREGNIIRVVTLDSLKLEELSTEVIQLNYTTAEDAQEAIKDMLTDRGKLTYDSRINALVVTDLATNIYKIKQVVRLLDKKTPQIMIEAKIIETVLGDEEKLGINWNLVISASGAKRPLTLPFEAWSTGWLGDVMRSYLPVPQITGTSATQSGTSSVVAQNTPADFPTGRTFEQPFPFVPQEQFTFGTLDFSQFGAVLEYLKTRSDTDIISSPRITTLNNRTAKMFVGKVFNYISEIEQKQDTGGQERWTYEIEQEEIGIRLLVTPHINDNGDIEIEVKPEIRDVIGQQYITEYFWLPIFSTREAETQVMMRDGETIFIGGLIKENIKQFDKKFPILGDLVGDLPIIGPLFKYKTESKEKVELIFFMTVHVVKDLKRLKKFATRDLAELELDLEEAEELAESVREQMPPIEVINAGNVEKDKLSKLGPSKKKAKSKKAKSGPLFDFRKTKK